MLTQSHWASSHAHHLSHNQSRIVSTIMNQSGLGNSHIKLTVQSQSVTSTTFDGWAITCPCSTQTWVAQNLWNRWRHLNGLNYIRSLVYLPDVNLNISEELLREANVSILPPPTVLLGGVGVGQDVGRLFSLQFCRWREEKRRRNVY